MSAFLTRIASVSLVLALGLGARAAAAPRTEPAMSGIDSTANSVSGGDSIAGSSSRLKPRRWHSELRFSAGQVALDMRGVDRLLAGQGLRAASRATTFGPQLSGSFGLWRLDLTGQMLVPGSRRSGDLTLRTSGGYGVLSMGLAAVRTPALVVIPQIGIGAAALRLDFAYHESVSMDSLVRSPRTESVVTGRSYVGQAGLSVRARLPVHRHGQPFLLAIEGGALSPLSATHWRRAYEEVHGRPRATLRGTYLRIGIGSSSESAGGALVPTLLSLIPIIR